jgi:hypothetical protein
VGAASCRDQVLRSGLDCKKMYYFIVVNEVGN